jgi:hypothetical protein
MEPRVVMFCAAMALLAAFAVFIGEVVGAAKRFKRSQEWHAEDGHDRAERRELEWYWNSDPEKKSRGIST